MFVTIHCRDLTGFGIRGIPPASLETLGLRSLYVPIVSLVLYAVVNGTFCGHS